MKARYSYLLMFAVPIAMAALLTLAAGITLSTVALALLHQFTVGNLGSAPGFEICNEFCGEHDFDTFSLRGVGVCRCLDAAGEDALTIELAKPRWLVR